MRRRWLAALAIAATLSIATFPTAADAVAPSKAGWWNAAAAGGLAAPLPTTATGDLHVGQGVTGPTAYAAVGYALSGQQVTSAVLEVKLTNTVGTPALVACATANDSWHAVEDGDMAQAPAYDCTKGRAFGIVSATGDTVTFLLPQALQLNGSYSLALVPDSGATPFQVDIVKPPTESLTVTAADAPATSDAGSAAPPPATVSSGTAPLNPGTAVVAPATAPLAVAPAPAVAGPETPAAQAPVVAAPGVPAAARSLPPVSNRERYVAGSLLALIAGAVVWALQQPVPTPRLIGGLARVNDTGEPLTGPVRGIGRFASTRAAPARSLV